MAATWVPIGTRSARSVQALSEAAPSGNDGILLWDVSSVVPVVHAPNGQTFTGIGTLLGYVKSSGVWLRSPLADVDLSDANGLSDVALTTLLVDSPRDRFALIASGIGLSGGIQITLEMICVTRGGLDV